MAKTNVWHEKTYRHSSNDQIKQDYHCHNDIGNIQKPRHHFVVISFVKYFKVKLSQRRGEQCETGVIELAKEVISQSSRCVRIETIKRKRKSQ